MTMIIALHLGAYVIVAADKRETYQVNGEVVSILSDDVQKLIEWHGGVATGSGYVPLLSDFKVRLSKSDVSSTNQIIEIARECFLGLPQEQAGWIKYTNWLFTYTTDAPQGLVTRVAFIKSASPESIGVLEEGRSLIWARMPDFESQLSRLNSLLRPERDLSNLRESLNYHLDVLVHLYSYVATVNSSVSAQFECFVHAPQLSGMVPSA